jgi:hypothetical protein
MKPSCFYETPRRRENHISAAVELFALAGNPLARQRALK